MTQLRHIIALSITLLLLCGMPLLADMDTGSSHGLATGNPEDAESHNFSVHIFYPLSTTDTPMDFSYLNFTLLYGRMGEVRGLDLGYGFSLIHGNMTGLQGQAGVSYVGGDLRGVSHSGLAGLVKGDVRGLQNSGLLSWSGGNVYGVQSSGIVNIAKEVRGVQAGLVNISEQMYGVPIGLINLSRNGGVQVSGWYGSLTEVNMGLRFRAGHFYSLFGFGFTGSDYSGLAEAADSAETLSYSFAFGASIPAGPFALNLDAGILCLDNDRFAEMDEGSDRWGVRGRAVLELPLFGGLSVFGGIGTAYLVDAKEEPTEQDFADGTWEELYILGGGFEF